MAPAPARNLKRVAPDTLSGGGPYTQVQVVAGDEVEHETFGKGKVLNVEGSAPNEKATVFFPSTGQKQLLLKYAKLKLIR
jgi:DNA helicase-2/ATP-dependent DNA helicase PcrA